MGVCRMRVGMGWQQATEKKEQNASGLDRTNDLAVNSRTLCRLSYQGLMF